MNESSQLTHSLIQAFIYSVFVVLGLFFVFTIREVLLMFYVAIILSLAFDAPIDWLQKRNIHRLLNARGIAQDIHLCRHACDASRVNRSPAGSDPVIQVQRIGR